MKQDSIWDFYQNEMPEVFSGSRARLLFLAKKVKPKGRVLNIGVGDGTFEERAIKLGFDVYSLDPSERSVASIRQRFSMSERARVGYSQDIPFTDQHFDSVVISEVIEHLSDEVIEKTLSEISRVLSLGGRIIGTVPARENLSEQLIICPDCGKRFHRWGHVQTFDSRRLMAILTKHFEVKEMFERPFITWSALNWKGKAIAVIKMCLWKLGFQGSGEQIFFCGIKR